MGSAYNQTLALQDAVFQRNQALIAKLNGPFMSVYRVAPGVSGSIMNGQIYDAFPAMMLRTTSRKFIENSMFELLMFEAIMDTTVLEYGDLLIDGLSGERYIYGQRRPLQSAIVVRAELLVTIGQPYNPGSARPRTPRGPGGYFVPNYAVARNDVTQPVTLIDGAYALGSVGDTPAQIPAAVQMKPTVGGPHDPDLSNPIMKAMYVMYVPPLPGSVVIRENMTVSVLGSDVQYIIQSCLTNAEGFVGTVCEAQKAAV